MHTLLVSQHLSTLKANSSTPAASQRRGRARFGAWRKPRVLIVLGLLALLMTLPALVPLDGYSVNLDDLLQPPSLSHPLGTDDIGRDSLARLLVGARMTLGIGGLAERLSRWPWALFWGLQVATLVECLIAF